MYVCMYVCMYVLALANTPITFYLTKPQRP
eukprot:COSAG01_NODE_64764_length_275_cov_0.880682_1_plen_29_part_10